MEHVVELDQEGRVCSADHLFDSQIGQCCPEHKVRYNRDSARNDTVAHVYTDAIAAPNSTCGVWLLLPLPPLLLLLLPLLPPRLSPLLPLLLMGGVTSILSRTARAHHRHTNTQTVVLPANPSCGAVAVSALPVQAPVRVPERPG